MSQVAEPAPAAGDRSVLDLREELIRLWDEIEQYVVAARSGVVLPGQDLSDEELKVVRLWASLFSEEIDVVRAARNVAVHAPGRLELRELIEAIEVAARLKDLLMKRLRLDLPV